MPTTPRDAAHAPADGVDSPARRPTVREVDSGELLCGGEELLIRHRGSVYRLRLTRQDKLILTK